MTLIGALTLALVLGATLRLTRLVITDDMGHWWVRGPAERWAARHDHVLPEVSDIERTWVPGWRTKLTSGLDCPFCVGHWIGVLVLVSLALVGGPDSTSTGASVWRWVAGALTLNWIAAHIGARMGDAGYASDE